MSEICGVSNCAYPQQARGICADHLKVIAPQVEAGTATWKQYEDAGICTPVKDQSKPRSRQCITPNCPRTGRSRGLCNNCYAAAVRVKEQRGLQWLDLEQLGLTRPARIVNQCKQSAFQKAANDAIEKAKTKLGISEMSSAEEQPTVPVTQSEPLTMPAKLKGEQQNMIIIDEHAELSKDQAIPIGQPQPMAPAYTGNFETDKATESLQPFPPPGELKGEMRSAIIIDELAVQVPPDTILPVPKPAVPLLTRSASQDFSIFNTEPPVGMQEPQESLPAPTPEELATMNAPAPEPTLEASQEALQPAPVVEPTNLDPYGGIEPPQFPGPKGGVQ